MPRTLAFTGAHRTGLMTTNYLAVVGKGTMWPGARGRKFDEVKDGPGNTILVVENQGLGVHWMEPRDLAFAGMDFRIDSPDGVSSWYVQPAAALADGSVRRLSKEMTPDALRAALTVAGGEDLSALPGGWTTIADGRDRERKP